MTENEILLATTLSRIRFLSASKDKRFVRNMAHLARYNPLVQMTQKQKRYLIQLCHKYRRQLPVEIVEMAAREEIFPPRKYRPSNGTIGDIFMGRFCDNCKAWNICKIFSAAMAYSIDDPKYPEQWQYSENGEPVCTSFRDKKEEKPARTVPRCTRTIDMFGEERAPA